MAEESIIRTKQQQQMLVAGYIKQEFDNNQIMPYGIQHLCFKFSSQITYVEVSKKLSQEIIDNQHENTLKKHGLEINSGMVPFIITTDHSIDFEGNLHRKDLDINFCISPKSKGLKFSSITFRIILYSEEVHVSYVNTFVININAHQSFGIMSVSDIVNTQGFTLGIDIELLSSLPGPIHFNQNNKMKRKVDNLRWCIQGRLLQSIHKFTEFEQHRRNATPAGARRILGNDEYKENVKYWDRAMSPLFDNKRWMFKIVMPCIWLRLLELPPNIMTIYVRLDGYVLYDDERRDFESVEMSFNMSDTSNRRSLQIYLNPNKDESGDAVKGIANERIIVDLNLEIVEVYKKGIVEIPEDEWEKYGIITD